MNRRTKRFVPTLMLRIAVIGAGVMPLAAQAPTVERPAFEVASIKPNVTGKEGGGGGPRGDRFIVTNVPLRMLVNIAFRPPKGQLLNQQIIGGPDWTRTDRFDIEAKMRGSYPTIPYERIQLMVQSLLEDRFQLKTHREMRELAVYNLVVTKGGARISQDQTPPDPRQTFVNYASPGEQLQPLPRGAMRIVRGVSETTLTGTAVPVSELVGLLQGQSDRIIIDKTDLKALLDVNLQFSEFRVSAPDVPASDALTGPSLFTAIQELGLKLESSKALLDVVVIDHVEKPSEN